MGNTWWYSGFTPGSGITPGDLNRVQPHEGKYSNQCNVALFLKLLLWFLKLVNIYE